MVKFYFNREMFDTLAEAKKAAANELFNGETSFIFSVNITSGYNPYAYNYRKIEMSDSLRISKPETCYIPRNEYGTFKFFQKNATW